MDLETPAGRWIACWQMAQHELKSMSPADRLDRALVTFLADELEQDDGRRAKALVFVESLACARSSGTHTREAMSQAADRILLPPRKPLLSPAWRIGIVGAATWAASCFLWLAIDETDLTDEQTLLLAFGVPALVASAFAGWRWATKR